MKLLALATTALLALGASAGAADIPMRTRGPAYTTAPVPQSTWTGWYVGGNIGYSWGRSENDVQVTGLPPGILGLSTASLVAGDHDRQNADGIIGGLQTGYN